jgi:hypothetical protein
VIASSVRIDTSRIRDWPTFHDEFNRVFQFPAFYGRNMDAWIDCMSYLDTPDEEMTGVHCSPGYVLTIELSEAQEFKRSCPEQFSHLLECAGFVNWRRTERGLPPLLALSFYS